MNSAGRRNSIVTLFCSDRLAVAMGALLLDQPASDSRVMAEHMAGLTAGNVIAVMATSGENYLWPVLGGGRL